jgi:hypothetical protein
MNGFLFTLGSKSNFGVPRNVIAPAAPRERRSRREEVSLSRSVIAAPLILR